jgi:hypothetical protein
VSKKKSSNSRFSASFFSGETENKIILILLLKNNSNLNNLKESYWEKIFSFPNFVYLKIGFSRKNAILRISTRKKSLIRAGTVD